MKHLLPPTSIYIQYLSTASARFNLSMNECRDKFGLYTEKQWLDLLSAMDVGIDNYFRIFNEYRMFTEDLIYHRLINRPILKLMDHHDERTGN